MADSKGITYPIPSNSDRQNKLFESKWVSGVGEKDKSENVNEPRKKIISNDDISENEPATRDFFVISNGDHNEKLEVKKGRRGRKRGRPRKSVDSQIPIRREEKVKHDDSVIETKERRHLRSIKMSKSKSESKRRSKEMR